MKKRFKNLARHMAGISLGIMIVMALFIVFPLASSGFTFLGGWDSEILVGMAGTSDWLTGYAYRCELTVDDSGSGAQTDYPMMLTVYKTTGSGAGTVGLDGNCQDDFDDIRFTKDDGITELDYWTDEGSIVSGTSCETWIEIDATADETFYMYYDNPSATDGSNMSAVFTQSDDFEWGSDGDSLGNDGGDMDWTVNVSGSSAIAIDTAQQYGGTRSGEFYIHSYPADNCDAYFTQVAGSDYAISFKVRREADSFFFFGHGDGINSFMITVDSDGVIYYTDGAIGGMLPTAISVDADTWYPFEISDIDFTGDGSYDIWFNGTKEVDDAEMDADSSFEDQVLFVQALDSDISFWLDNMIIRKWSDPEPDWEVAGDAVAYGSIMVDSSLLMSKGTDSSKVIGAEYYPEVALGGAGDTSPPDIAPTTGNPDWTDAGDSCTARLAANPFHPLIEGMSTASSIPERQLWIIGATLIILFCTIAGFAKAPHQLITVAIGTVLTILFITQCIFPWWTIFVYLVIAIAILVYEREPTIA